MPPEVQDAIATGQEMMDQVDKKKKKFDETIGEIKKKIDSVEKDYVGRSQQFIDEKKKQLQDELAKKTEAVDKEIARLKEIATTWLNEKKEELTKKAAEKVAKILTGISAPDIDPSDEN